VCSACDNEYNLAGGNCISANDLSGGAIAGIVLGTIFGLVVVIALLKLLYDKYEVWKHDHHPEEKKEGEDKEKGEKKEEKGEEKEKGEKEVKGEEEKGKYKAVDSNSPTTHEV